MVKVLIFVLFSGLVSFATAQVRLRPQADGYVYLSGGANFGGEPVLVTRYTRRSETTAYTYVRYDLTGQAGSFRVARFGIYGRSEGSAKLVDVFSAFGDWSDSSLKGASGLKPSRANFLGSFAVSSSEKEYQVDITAYVNYALSIGRKDLTLVLVEREQQTEGGVTQFHSRENASGHAPYLYLEGGGGAFKPANSTYYVDAASGNDGADGRSPGTAWKTLAKVESVFLQQGDQVLFKRGSVFKGSLFLKVIPSLAGVSGASGSERVASASVAGGSASGTASAVTKLGAYGSGDKPVLDAEGKESFCLMFFNTPFVEVEGLKITQSATDIPALRRGIYYLAEDMGEVQHVQFRNLNIENIVGNKGKDDGDLYAKRNAGLSLEITGNNTPTYLNGYLIEGCRFCRLGRHGAVNQSSWSRRTLTTNTNWVPSRNVVIRRNVFEETMSDGLIVRVADGPLMEYNLFKRCSIELSGNASFTFNCDNAVWQFNEACYTVYNTGDSDAAGFDSDFKSKNTIIQYNYAHHNEYGDILITGGPASAGGFNDGTIVRYNVFYNNGHHGIRLSGLTTNSKVYNNVIYKDLGIARPTEPYVEYPANRLFYTKNWGGWPKDGFYANNIYYYVGDSVAAASDLNVVQSPGSRFFNNIIYANKIVSYPEEVNGLRADPLIKLPVGMKDWEGLDKMLYFRVGKGSPAVDAGIRVEGTVGKDYSGTAVPSGKGVDIGAFEYK